MRLPPSKLPTEASHTNRHWAQNWAQLPHLDGMRGRAQAPDEFRLTEGVLLHQSDLGALLPVKAGSLVTW